MADAYSAYDVARLAFDGTDTSTTMTDALGHTFTASGTAQLKTGKKRYGTASLYYDNASAGVTGSTSTDWDMGAGNFCIDGFFSPLSTNQLNGLFCIDNATGADTAANSIDISQNNAGDLIARIFISGVAYDIQTATNLLFVNSWYHVAFVRVGTGIYLYLDGTLVGSNTNAGIGTNAVQFPASSVCRIGGIHFGGGSIFPAHGYLDSWRVTKGHARYTTPFVPPVNGNFDSVDDFITTTTLGTRTRQVTVAPGCVNQDAVLASIDAAVVALGWTVYDGVYRGTILRVYRCLNKDATTYKYALLFFDKSRMRLTLTSCELWDIANKTITNECWSNYRADGQMGFAMDGCDILIFGSARYLGMMTYIHTSPSLWAVCVETEREAAEDTAAAGYPCWGMIHSGSFLYDLNGTNHNSIRYPRNRFGATGQSATNWQTQVTSIGAWGRFGLSTSRFAQTMLGNGSWKNLNHAWDTAKKLVSHVKFIMDDNASTAALAIYGRLFGVKVCAPMGNLMDKVSLPIDSDMWFTVGGTETNHWLLPTNIIANNHLYGIGGTAPTDSTYALGTPTQHACFTGRYLYTAAATTVTKLDVTNGNISTVAGITQIIQDIVFDGRYVYASYVTGIYRIDTHNADALTSLTVGTGGIRGLCWSGRQFLYGSDMSAATQPKLYKIDTTTFTSIATITMPARVTASVVPSICTNGENHIGCSVGNTTTAADLAMGLIDINTNSGTWVGVNGVTGYVSSETGLAWTGAQWMWTHGWAGGVGTSIAHCHLFTNNTTTILSTHYQVSNVNITASTNVRSFCDRVGQFTWSVYPSTTVTSPQIAVGGLSGPEYTPGIINNAFGGAAGSSPPRWAFGTGNSFFMQTNDNTVHYLTQNHKNSFNGIQYANTLLPV